ncbi:MAG: tyrosine recombinase XerC [Betaproteobacteria bacterium]
MSPEPATAAEAARPAQALVDRYLAHVRVQKRLAERTVALYTQDLLKLQQWAEQAGVALEQVNSHQVRRWVAQMHSRGRSARGIALILSGWRGFYSWLGREALVASNPVQGVRAPKAAKPLPKALGVEEAVQLAGFESESAAPDLDARDHCLTELLYGCGLRIGEVAGLDLRASAQARGWIDLQDAQAHVLGKGGKRRSVPVGLPALRSLQAWLAVRSVWVAERTEASAALFITRQGRRLSARQMQERLKSRSLAAGLATPVHPHMLRHSFASHVLQSSGDLRAVQELLGHANISTTQVYTRLDFQHLAKVYDAAHPRAHPKK